MGLGCEIRRLVGRYEILAFNELHHQRPDPPSFFEAVDLCDVRVVQGGENLRFPLESGEPLWIASKGLGAVP